MRCRGGGALAATLLLSAFCLPAFAFCTFFFFGFLTTALAFFFTRFFFFNAFCSLFRFAGFGSLNGL